MALWAYPSDGKKSLPRLPFKQHSIDSEAASTFMQQTRSLNLLNTLKNMFLQSFSNPSGEILLWDLYIETHNYLAQPDRQYPDRNCTSEVRIHLKESVAWAEHILKSELGVAIASQFIEGRQISRSFQNSRRSNRERIINTSHNCCWMFTERIIVTPSYQSDGLAASSQILLTSERPCG
jgi:hypothetical protein